MPGRGVTCFQSPHPGQRPPLQAVAAGHEPPPCPGSQPGSSPTREDCSPEGAPSRELSLQNQTNYSCATGPADNGGLFSPRCVRTAEQPWNIYDPSHAWPPQGTGARGLLCQLVP